MTQRLRTAVLWGFEGRENVIIISKIKLKRYYTNYKQIITASPLSKTDMGDLLGVHLYVGICLGLLLCNHQRKVITSFGPAI